jgi:ubiquinone/menaquinone biosynthesis C-methylase UbiE
MSKEFYKKVELYYDDDAKDFEERYWQNPTLQHIRQDFREHVKRFKFTNMLEIGYGTGLDLKHFAITHSEANVFGVDISGEMHKYAKEKISNAKLDNAVAEKGSVEDIKLLFPNMQFDIVYVFFGALNTVDDINKAAQELFDITAPNGVVVLSFVNKYYLLGILIELFKLRFRSAFSRLKQEWGGYSPNKSLPSRCYSVKEVRKTFQMFKLIREKGYCILHPAWYYLKINKLLGSRGRRILWKVDSILCKSFLWRFGEYTLFVFQKPNNIK